jgi:carbon monoxide dehydrogenase subunit G
MTILKVEADVHAPPEQVWEVVSDPRNLTTWDRHIAAVTGVPEGGLKKGTGYETEIRFMGVRTHVHADVLEIDPPRYAKIRLHGLLDATVETWVELMDDGRTKLRHQVDYRFRGGALGDLGARVVRAMGGSSLLKRGVQAQKRQAEERAGS